MEQNDITQIYETLAPMAGQYANAQAEQIGQAQQSMGPLAAATMGQSQTAGLGNYTYNRLMRPQVDVMRDEILVEGYRNQLNRALSNAYNTARKNYNRRAGGWGGNGGGGNSDGNNTTGSNGDTSAWDGEIEKSGITKHKQAGDYDLFTIKGPQYPNGIQWKYTAGEDGGVFDNPVLSYDTANGLARIRSLIKSGHQVYNEKGQNITSRFK